MQTALDLCMVWSSYGLYMCTGRDYQHAGAKGRVTRQRTPGHTVGSGGQRGE